MSLEKQKHQVQSALRSFLARRATGENVAVTQNRRVLMVVNDARFLVTHRLSLVLGLREAGYDVHVAAPAVGEPANVIRNTGIPLHDMPIDRQGVNLLNDLRAMLALIK